MKVPKSRKAIHRKQNRLSEVEEIELLEEWIDAQKPLSGSNPLAIPPPPPDAAIGRLPEGQGFSPYAGCKKFDQLPISEKTKEGLAPKYKTMSEIQRASLPHSLCGRDVLGAAKTGSGKSLAFIIPVLEKLYRARWGPEDGVGSIIISPTRELAMQLFEEVKSVGQNHTFSAGLLIGGRKDVDEQKDHVNNLNILVCTPGRLLQHMDETPNFDCSQLQILVLDEADRILDVGFKGTMNAIISQLPKRRQTLLFSATQTKSVQDLARLSLKDPEYLSVHAESITATPRLLQQTVMVVPLQQKLDMLWSFLKSHLKSKMLVFLSSCKQVKFVFEAFKKLRPGIPLLCLHGRMKQETRMAIYFQFCEKNSVLFSTDVASRGLDIPAVDWVIQVDCPEDVPSYIHRVGRTARFTSGGQSVLFLDPSETQMLTKLQEAKVPVELKKANTSRLQTVSSSLASLLVKYPNLQHLGQRAFITYLKSVHLQHDKEVFDVMKLPVEEYAASLGLPMTPKIRFMRQKRKNGSAPDDAPLKDEENISHHEVKAPVNEPVEEDDILVPKAETHFEDGKGADRENPVDPENGTSITSVKKKKKLKINIHRPAGTRVVFDDEGNTLPPLAAVASADGRDTIVQLDKIEERYKKLKAEMKQKDKEDKLLLRQRLREKRTKEKMKFKRGRAEDEDMEVDDEISASDNDGNNRPKRSKVYFDSESDGERKETDVELASDSVTLAEQEALALKLLSSMHS
ncbi:hypothetical protein H6P81_006964 [Aristolochia fimbriata]|uniref:ATP-dependent RNA helicase n=1 Tax=Aristolochia fimbriata TaxID=158543 RepID=A0AAV7F0Z2_ARIFI|nr:hypothetical protein H6P81_006964 [Aristolochia fimbriata]